MSAARRPLAAVSALVLLALGAGGFAACGRTGALQQPAPMFGERAQADYTAAQERRLAARRVKRGDAASASTGQSNPDKTDSSSTGDDDAPMTARDIKDPGQKLTTLRSDPAPGEPNSMGAPPSLTPPN